VGKQIDVIADFGRFAAQSAGRSEGTAVARVGTGCPHGSSPVIATMRNTGLR